MIGLILCSSLLLSSPPQQAVAPIKDTTSKTPIALSEPSSMMMTYLNLFKQTPDIMGPLGNRHRGEIEILTQIDQIQKVQSQTCLRLIAKGYADSDAEKWSRVGIVAEDNYWMWIRDAVIFPSGIHGTYDRLLWKSGLDGPPGIAVLPVLPTKKIIVNVNYRHATRSWEIELPRGQRNVGESCEKAATRELQEETGYLATKCTMLGMIAPDSGTLMSQFPVYYAEANLSGEVNKEYSEAIANNPAFTKEEIKQGFLKGYMEVLIKGTLIKVPCRDPVLSYAILQAEMRGYL